jgi:Co/Zn/Cd efflux system component
VLSLRPGGLRRQLRLITRRLRIAMILAGIYMVGSAVLRLFLPNELLGQVAMVVLGLGLGIAFLVLIQDPPLETGR